MNALRLSVFAVVCLVCAACSFSVGLDSPPAGVESGIPLPDLSNAEEAQVASVIDGDTIDVLMDGSRYRVRYVGVNTPERDEACYNEATAANTALVRGQSIRMIPDQSDTDQYGRLLRYIFVGDHFVNAELVANGWAEAVEYNPDRRYTANFRILESEARDAGLGCHPTGIFDDGSDVR
jgi:endonuclease YncB( thermonuclease family)